jgi:hypothetical protein
VQDVDKPLAKKGAIDYSSYDLNSAKIAFKQDGQKNFKRNNHVSKNSTLSNSSKLIIKF